MKIISWDVGIIHLAYCILDYNVDDKKNKVKLLDWDEINLLDDERINYSCCGKKKKTSDLCGKCASYVLKVPNCEKMYGFCKTHLSQSDEYWSNKKTENMFTKKESGSCQYIKTSGDICGANAKYCYENNDSNKMLCTAHFKICKERKIKKYSPSIIKNESIKKISTAKLQLNLIKKLDSLLEKFASYEIDEVIIENQPSLKSPKMKSLSTTLFDYFIF